MVTDAKTNGNYKQHTIKASNGTLIDCEEIHRVVFHDNTIVKCFLFPPIDDDLPEGGEVNLDFHGFKITGIYSDKDVKVVKAEGGCIFPKHRHPGKEWIEVIKGKITVYHYRELLAVGLLLFGLTTA